MVAERLHLYLGVALGQVDRPVHHAVDLIGGRRRIAPLRLRKQDRDQQVVVDLGLCGFVEAHPVVLRFLRVRESTAGKQRKDQREDKRKGHGVISNICLSLSLHERRRRMNGSWA